VAIVDVLLALLVPGPSHGYDLKRTHDQWFADGKPLAYGQVYSTLGRLERDGYVSVAHTEAGAGPDRVVYELTSAGRERVRGWLDETVEPDPPGTAELIKRTVAAIRLGLDPDGFLTRQREARLRRMRELGDAEPADPLAALVHDHAVAHLDADLRWLDLAAGRLSTHTPGGTR
jgi:DNA-binding PadR family transcriptional regulator